MSFTRVNPSGWAVGSTLTAAQQNQLDIDHAKALDKSVAGDTISGTVTLASGASIAPAFGSSVVFASGALLTISSGAAEYVSSGGQIIVQGGGSILLADGGSDIVLAAGKTTQVLFQPVPQALNSSGFTIPNQQLTGGATAFPVYCPIPPLHNGATITAVSLFFEVTSSHANVPQFFPSIDIRRVQVGIGGGTDVSLRSGGPVSATAATGLAWYDSGAMQVLTFTPNQNNVVDSTQYFYYVTLVDENGTHAISGNLYYAVEVFLGNITSLALG